MKKLCCILALITALPVMAQKKTTDTAARRITLPNGWSLTPVGRSLPLGDLPLNMVLSSSGKFLAVTNNGQGRQTIQLIAAAKETLLDEVTIPKSWLGLAFSKDEKYLYASGGNDNVIWKYAINNNKLQRADSISLGKPWPEKIGPAGIAIDDAHKKLYVVTKENNSLYIVDLTTNKVQNKVPLEAEAYTCVLSPDA
ncbi:MAG TPA: YncE family protein, partial [Chitinophaga sp.]